MSNQLAVIEKSLMLLRPNFGEVLAGYGITPERIIRTVMVSCERAPKLQQMPVQTILNSAMTAAVLGLEVDGVTGQGFLIPFGGNKPGEEFIGGYKGLITVAARGGYSIAPFLVRDGDVFEPNYIDPDRTVYKPKLGRESDRAVVAAFAIARSNTMPSKIKVLSIDQLKARRDASKGYKAKPSDHPWKTNFDAMCLKTPVRDMSNILPINMLYMAAALETQHDLGHLMNIKPDGTAVIDSVVVADEPPVAADIIPRSDYVYIRADGVEKPLDSIDQYVRLWDFAMGKMTVAQIRAAVARNK